MPSLHDLRRVRQILVKGRWLIYTKYWGMDIAPTVQFSLSANFDKTYPRGVHVGDHTYVAFGAAILTHDRTRGLYLDTRIGAHCFIGARSIILPGITIGHSSVVGAGAVVTKDVPPRTTVAGNPAIVIQRDIEVGHYGRFNGADATTQRLKAEGLL